MDSPGRTGTNWRPTYRRSWPDQYLGDFAATTVATIVITQASRHPAGSLLENDAIITARLSDEFGYLCPIYPKYLAAFLAADSVINLAAGPAPARFD